MPEEIIASGLIEAMSGHDPDVTGTLSRDVLSHNFDMMLVS